MTQRRARCTYYGQTTGSLASRDCSGYDAKVCRCEQASDPRLLAFFESQPDEPFDRFYCGCIGWD